MNVHIHTDGSSNNMDGSGGYGVVFRAKQQTKEYFSGRYKGTTNNRMELKAIIYALENCDSGHKIYLSSDSEYCINSINEYLDNWLLNGKFHKKKNKDLWERFIKSRDIHIDRGTKLKFTWVKGHSDNKYNNIADKLANQARALPLEEAIQCLKDN